MPKRPVVSLLLALFCLVAPWPSARAERAPIVKMDDPVVLSLGARLRCPVCQGMPIGESPAPMAQDMMREVRRLRLQEGQSEEQIAAHFTERYGTWVLLDPPKQGFGLVVWMLPPAVLMLGLGAALGSVAHKRAVAAAQNRGQNPARPQGTTPQTQADAELLAKVRRQAES